MSSDTEKRFNLSVNMVKNLKKKPTNEEMLTLYGFYKQALIGNCNIDEPNKIYIKDYGKWKYWNNLKNISKNDAMASYSDLTLELIDKYGY